MEKTSIHRKRILRMRDNCLKVGLGQSSIYDLVSRGLFPKPFPLVPGGRAVGWLEEDIDQWISERKAASKQGEI
jgi:prophage regulatory protein